MSLEVLLSEQSLLDALLDLLDVFKLGEAGDLLEPDALLQHRLLLQLHLPLSFQLSHTSRFLLPTNALLISKNLLGLHAEILQELSFPLDLVLLLEDLLAKTYLRKGYLVRITSEKRVLTLSWKW